MAQIIPTAEPFFFLGDASKPACLLVHGFTSSPKEMRLLGEFLHHHGHTCLCMRNPGHATQPEDMIRSTYQDWIAAVEDGYHILRGISSRICLVGLSMGGALALLTSARLDVLGVAVMSTPYKLPDDPRLRHIELISKAVPFMPKGTGEPGSGWVDKEAWKEHVSYPMNPVRSIGELNKLLGELRAALPEIKVPVLLIHSQDDTYVPPQNMELLHADLVNARERIKLYISGSGHVVTRDAARQQVFESVLEFVQRVGGNG